MEVIGAVRVPGQRGPAQRERGCWKSGMKREGLERDRMGEEQSRLRERWRREKKQTDRTRKKAAFNSSHRRRRRGENKQNGNCTFTCKRMSSDISIYCFALHLFINKQRSLFTRK